MITRLLDSLLPARVKLRALVEALHDEGEHYIDMAAEADEDGKAHTTLSYSLYLRLKAVSIITIAERIKQCTK